MQVVSVFYFFVVKSISFDALPAAPDLSQVHAPAARRPHAQEAPAAGLTFSVVALEHEHWRAGFAPQEQVACWAVRGGEGRCQQGWPTSRGKETRVREYAGTYRRRKRRHPCHSR